MAGLHSQLQFSGTFSPPLSDSSYGVRLRDHCSLDFTTFPVHNIHSIYIYNLGIEQQAISLYTSPMHRGTGLYIRPSVDSLCRDGSDHASYSELYEEGEVEHINGVWPIFGAGKLAIHC